MNRCHYNKNQYVKQGFRLTIHKILTFRSLFPFSFHLLITKRPPAHSGLQNRGKPV